MFAGISSVMLENEDSLVTGIISKEAEEVSALITVLKRPNTCIITRSSSRHQFQSLKTRKLTSG